MDQKYCFQGTFLPIIGMLATYKGRFTLPLVARSKGMGALINLGSAY